MQRNGSPKFITWEYTGRWGGRYPQRTFPRMAVPASLPHIRTDDAQVLENAGLVWSTKLQTSGI